MLLKFRKAKPSEISSIIGLYRASFSWAWTKTGRKFDETYVRKQLRAAIKSDYTLVGLDGIALWAFGWAKTQKDHFGNPFGEIVLLLVHPKIQNQGIGAELLEKLESKLPQDKRIYVLAENRSLQLYKRKGYGVFGQSLRKIS